MTSQHCITVFRCKVTPFFYELSRHQAKSWTRPPFVWGCSGGSNFEPCHICDFLVRGHIGILAGFCRHRRPLFRLLVDCVGSSASCRLPQQVVASSHMPYQFARLCKTVQPLTCLDQAHCTDVRLRPSSIIYLDAPKAFDKVLHYCLFVKLLKRNVSVGCIHLLVNWYSNLTSCVLWNNCFRDVLR